MNSSRRIVSTCIAKSSTRNHAISGVTSAKGWCLSRQRWIVGAVIAFLTLCFAQPSAAQATINVNTTQQGVTTGQCSLQEAIYATEFQSSTAIDTTDPDHTYSTGCVAGTGKGDTIVLPAGATFEFDRWWDQDAHNVYGTTATPVIFSNISILGNGSTLEWVGSRQGVYAYSRLFAVGVASVTVPGGSTFSGTGGLYIENVYIKGFAVQGGNGGICGGGGGLGAGGAIYVQNGTLTVENSTFDSNGAAGGNGSSGCYPAEGGGGGLSGTGGLANYSFIGTENDFPGAGGGGGSIGWGGSGYDDIGGSSDTLHIAKEGGGGGGGTGGTVLSGGFITILSGGAVTAGIGGAGGYLCGGLVEVIKLMARRRRAREAVVAALVAFSSMKTRSTLGRPAVLVLMGVAGAADRAREETGDLAVGEDPVAEAVAETAVLGVGAVGITAASFNLARRATEAPSADEEIARPAEEEPEPWAGQSLAMGVPSQYSTAPFTTTS
jgi:hypothetical protein